MNQTEKLASAMFLIKEAEMDVGTSALTGGALGALLLALLGRGRRMGTGYRVQGRPYTSFPRVDPSDPRDLTVAGGIVGGVGGAGAGGLLAALSNKINSPEN